MENIGSHKHLIALDRIHKEKVNYPEKEHPLESLEAARKRYSLHFVHRRSIQIK